MEGRREGKADGAREKRPAAGRLRGNEYNLARLLFFLLLLLFYPIFLLFYLHYLTSRKRIPLSKCCPRGWSPASPQVDVREWSTPAPGRPYNRTLP